MAHMYRSLGGLAIVLMVGCSLDGSPSGSHASLPLLVTKGASGVSFGLAMSRRSSRSASGEADRLSMVGSPSGQPRPAEGALKVTIEGNGLTPLQAAGAPNLVTTFPSIPDAFDFGPTPVATLQQVTWTITNVGDAATGPLSLNSTFSSEFSANAASCAPLAPSASCSVTISYLPQSIGVHSSTFGVVGFPISYTFSGQGSAATFPTANLVTTAPSIPDAFDFGPTSVATLQQVTWTITNSGDAGTGALSISSSNNFEFSASAASCAPLAPSASCKVTISYLPQSIGVHSSTFGVVGFPISYTFSGQGSAP